MSLLALILVLTGSVAHAGWNLLLKRSDNKEVFVWSLLVAGSLLLAPWAPSSSGSIHFCSRLLADPGYHRGARLLLCTAGAGLRAGRPIPRVSHCQGNWPHAGAHPGGDYPGGQIAWPAVLGIVSIIVGIYVVSWWGRFREILTAPLSFLRDGGIRYALLTGLTITVYTLVDKRGVQHVQPILYMYLLTLGVAVGLAPYILRNYGWAPVLREWRAHAWPIVVAGLLVFAAYGLALTALSLSRVSYVAPAREVSIVVGVLAGVLILKEPFGRGRLLGSAMIVVGLVLIALSP